MTNIWSKLSFIFGIIGVILLIPLTFFVISVLTTPGKEATKFSETASQISILSSILSIIFGIIGLKKEKTKEAKRGIMMGVIIILWFVVIFVASLFIQIPE